MPIFDTPAPISVTIEIGVGDIRVVASERADTVVDVQPSDGSKQSHVTAAEQTRVERAHDVRIDLRRRRRVRSRARESDDRDAKQRQPSLHVVAFKQERRRAA